MATLRVLVVDDDVMLCRALSRMLRPHEVVVVSSGAEALDELRDGQFDVILCDVMMPEMTGPELYHALADVDEALQHRVLFMTGGLLDRVRPMMKGVPDRLVEKPFSRDAIREAIEEMAATASTSESPDVDR